MALSPTTISDFLFPAPARRSAAAIFIWWEARRLHFNLLVGGAGTFSLCVIAALHWLPPQRQPFPLEILPGALVFGVAANVFYLLGPSAECVLARIWGRKLLPAGPVLFRMGLTFSLGLALLPSMVAALDWGFRLLRWLF